MVVFMVEGKDIRHYEKVKALREAERDSINVSLIMNVPYSLRR
jgi:hypothetical protein